MVRKMEIKTLIYENPLSCPKDVKDFILEGQAEISFEQGHMRMRNILSQNLGQKANYVLWCPVTFPADLMIQWEFRPLSDTGLCMLFFAASGSNGRDLFDPSLAPRTGEYVQYYNGDINTFHVSYFRRKEPDERIFHTCNLRKSKGFYLTAQGADPLPGAADAKDFYQIALKKQGNRIEFFINCLPIFSFKDDGQTYGPLLGGGKIGFRQLAPLTAAYRNLKVYSLSKEAIV